MTSHNPVEDDGRDVAFESHARDALLRHINRISNVISALEVEDPLSVAAEHARPLTKTLEDAVSQILKLEKTFASTSKAARPAQDPAQALDLDAVRASIGGQLDKLRAAQSAKGVS